MLSEIDYMLIDQRLKDMEKQLEEIEQQFAMLRACVDVPNVLSSGSFVDAACKHAEDVILDKRMFFIDNSAFDAFERALEDNSLGDNQCLMKLTQRPKRWA